jgi:hypothetical protein
MTTGYDKGPEPTRWRAACPPGKLDAPPSATARAARHTDQAPTPPPIRGPRDARNTLRYVPNNARRHLRTARRNETRWTDPCSSAPWFRKWSVASSVTPYTPDPRYLLRVALGNAALPPKTPLLASGWSRAGPIELLYSPGPIDSQNGRPQRPPVPCDAPPPHGAPRSPATPHRPMTRLRLVRRRQTSEDRRGT